jgi:hypothetical protein
VTKTFTRVLQGSLYVKASDSALAPLISYRFVHNRPYSKSRIPCICPFNRSTRVHVLGLNTPTVCRLRDKLPVFKIANIKNGRSVRLPEAYSAACPNASSSHIVLNKYSIGQLALHKSGTGKPLLSLLLMSIAMESRISAVEEILVI